MKLNPFNFVITILLVIGVTHSNVNASTWETFLLAHTLDPTVNLDYNQWNGDRWRNWLAEREPLHLNENHHHGQRLTQKNINSVVIAGPNDIIATFEHPTHQYGGQYTWSNERFRTYVFSRGGGGHQRVLDCHELYFAARLDNDGRPVHFQTQYSDRISSGNANLRFNSDCTEIN